MKDSRGGSKARSSTSFHSGVVTGNKGGDRNVVTIADAPAAREHQVFYSLENEILKRGQLEMDGTRDASSARNWGTQGCGRLDQPIATCASTVRSAAAEIRRGE
eukprot:6185802-Pleurochrysis_carterae.AAC.7